MRLANPPSFLGRKDAKVMEYWTDNSLISKWTYPPPFTLHGEADLTGCKAAFEE